MDVTLSTADGDIAGVFLGGNGEDGWGTHAGKTERLWRKFFWVVNVWKKSYS